MQVLDSNALCARHPNRPAIATCNRCGDYACGECSGVAAEFCGSCMGPELEKFLNEHRRHARSIKALGFFFVFGAVMMATVALAIATGFRKEPQHGSAALFMLVGVPLSPLLGSVGWGLLGLRPWSRVAGSVLAFVGAFSIFTSNPISGWICAYGLYLLLSKRGAAAFSQRYRNAVAIARRVQR